MSEGRFGFEVAMGQRDAMRTYLAHLIALRVAEARQRVSRARALALERASQAIAVHRGRVKRTREQIRKAQQTIAAASRRLRAQRPRRR